MSPFPTPVVLVVMQFRVRHCVESPLRALADRKVRHRI